MFNIQPDSMHAGDEPSGNWIASQGIDADAKDLGPALPKVLVVDDNKLIADTITEILEGAGFRADTAYDGWMALEMARRLKPDYLLSDVLMPRMNGVELAIAVRKLYPAARILLFSGQAGISEILLEGRRQGFEFELIAKPVHPLKLIERLKEQ
jgi:CheY-like chemotaxis protein